MDDIISPTLIKKLKGIVEKANIIEEKEKEREEKLKKQSPKNIHKVPKTIFNKGLGRPPKYGTPREVYIGKLRAAGVSFVKR